MLNYPALIIGAVFTLLGAYTLIDGLRGYIHLSNVNSARGRKRFEDVLTKVQPLKTVYLVGCTAVLALGLFLLSSGLAPLFA